MNHDNYDDNYIRGILNGVKSIAMVGASPVNVRPSYFAFKYLAQRGYDMIPVNPGHVGKSLLGKPFVASLSDIGLVNRVVAAGTERDAAIALAQKVALKSAYTIKLGKEAFYRQAEMNLAEAYRYAAEVMTENMMARDAEEGIGAFIEKREPKWQDK